MLMDPLPPINKVFALISQEENQRKVGSSTPIISAVPNSTSAVAFVARSNDTDNSKRVKVVGRGQQKGRPFCTHCKKHGHSIERCYKLHGYPPGYKTRSRHNASANAVNQAGSEIKSDQASL